MENTTELLIATRKGDRQASEKLLEHVYCELRRLARAQRRRQPATLATTELVHEAYLKLFGRQRLEAHDRVHFLSLAARAMRQILVDHFRKRSAEKRGGGHVHADYDLDNLPLGDRGETLLAVDEALQRLSEKDERLGRVVEYKFFGGMTEPEIATALSISVRSVSNDWRRARAWLSREIEAGLGDA